LQQNGTYPWRIEDYFRKEIGMSSIPGITINVGRTMLLPRVAEYGTRIMYSPSMTLGGYTDTPALSNGHWMLFGPTLRDAKPVAGDHAAFGKVLREAVKKARQEGAQGGWYWDSDRGITGNSLPDFSAVLPGAGRYTLLDTEFRTAWEKGEAYISPTEQYLDLGDNCSVLAVDEFKVGSPGMDELAEAGEVCMDLGYTLALMESGASLWMPGTDSTDCGPILITDRTPSRTPCGCIMRRLS
jgi:hypothetical protein